MSYGPLYDYDGELGSEWWGYFKLGPVRIPPIQPVVGMTDRAGTGQVWYLFWDGADHLLLTDELPASAQNVCVFQPYDGPFIGATGWRLGVTTAAQPFNVITWNPANKHSSIMLSNGNLTATSSVNSWSSLTSTLSPQVTKSYWRVIFTGTNYVLAGLANTSAILSNYIGVDANGIGAYANPPGTGSVQLNSSVIGAFPALLASGDAIVLAYDQPAARLYVTTMTAAGVLNPNWNNAGANPSIGIGGFDVSSIPGPLVPAASLLVSGETGTLDTTTIINDPTLAGFTPPFATPAGEPHLVVDVPGTFEQTRWANSGHPLVAPNIVGQSQWAVPESTGWPTPQPPTVPGIPSSSPVPTGGGYAAFEASFATNSPPLVSFAYVAPNAQVPQPWHLALWGGGLE